MKSPIQGSSWKGQNQDLNQGLSDFQNQLGIDTQGLNVLSQAVSTMFDRVSTQIYGCSNRQP